MNVDTRTDDPRFAPSLAQQARIAFYLDRVDLRLSWYGLGWTRRRQIRKELKANVLDAATHEQSLAATFEQLGAPGDLAAAYADVEHQPRFLTHAAVRWGLITFAILQAVGIALDIGFRRGAQAAGAEGELSYAVELVTGLGPFTGTYAAAETATFTLLTPAHVVIVLVAALLGGRTWRLLSHR